MISLLSLLNINTTTMISILLVAVGIISLLIGILVGRISAVVIGIILIIAGIVVVPLVIKWLPWMGEQKAVGYVLLKYADGTNRTLPPNSIAQMIVAHDENRLVGIEFRIRAKTEATAEVEWRAVRKGLPDISMEKGTAMTVPNEDIILLSYTKDELIDLLDEKVGLHFWQEEKKVKFNVKYKLTRDGEKLWSHEYKELFSLTLSESGIAEEKEIIIESLEFEYITEQLVPLQSIGFEGRGLTAYGAITIIGSICSILALFIPKRRRRRR